MKLVYLTLEAPREGSASFVHVHEIIKGLKKRGWDVTLHQPPYAQKETSPALWRRLFIMLWMQVRLWAGWRRGAVLYIRAHYMAFPSCLLAWAFRIPVIHEINGPYEDTFVTHPSLNRVKKILLWIQRWQYRRAKGLIAVTKDLEEWARRESKGRPTAFITNGANTDLFRPDYPRPANLPKHYVLFFGGLARWHGVPAMLAAANNPAWPEDLALVIIGEGQESATAQQAARKNPLIHMMGRKPYEELPPYVAHSLAGLVPVSDPEGRSGTGVFPLKLFETLACGVPVIATDLPGQADFIRQYDCGYIIPVDDPAALVKAVQELRNDPGRAAEMGKRGREAVVKAHSWDSRASETADAIRNWLTR